MESSMDARELSVDDTELVSGGDTDGMTCVLSCMDPKKSDSQIYACLQQCSPAPSPPPAPPKTKE